MQTKQYAGYRVALAIVLAVCLNSCATTTVEPPALPHTPPQPPSRNTRDFAPLQHALSQYQTIETMEGYASVDIRAPELHQTIGCIVKIKRNEVMQITGTVFFGIIAAESLLREDSVFVYVPLQNVFWVGQNRPENIRRAIGFEASFAQASETFMGIAYLHSAQDSLQSLTTQNGRLIYAFQNGNETEILELDSLTHQVRELACFDKERRPIWQVRFEDFETVRADSAQWQLPKRIHATLWQYSGEQPPITRQVAIHYWARAINPKPFEISFQMPRAATVRRLEELNFWQR